MSGSKLEFFEPWSKSASRKSKSASPPPPTRVRIQPPPHRGGSHPGRRDHPVPCPGPRRTDRKDRRKPAWGPPRHHPSLQLDLARPAEACFRLEKPEIIAIAVRGAQMIKDRLPASPERHRDRFPIFAGKLQRHRGGVRQGDLRGRHGRLAAARPDEKSSSTCPTPSKWPLPNVYADQIEWISATSKTATPSSSAAHPQRPRHRHRRHRTGLAGWRRPRRRHPLRQWRTHRQPRHRHRSP
jgi:hypothetical protein